MNQQKTKAIVLSRINYREADRIITVITPDQGKLRLMVRGARQLKSKLAGGIELFSVNEISYITGKGEIGTLTSSRLVKHYPGILEYIERVQLGYELIKLIDRVTEDQTEQSYFSTLEETFAALNQTVVALSVIKLWFYSSLIKLGGHSPNLTVDSEGSRLDEKSHYDFDFSKMAFSNSGHGRYGANDIKYLRLLFKGEGPIALSRIEDAPKLTASLNPLINQICQMYLHP